MFTIVWNPRWFHLIKVLENDCMFNTGHYIAEILKPLSQWRSIEAVGNGRKLLVHADNAPPHTAKLSTQYFNENRMKSALHPSHSPGLAPSDLYLFGYVKRCLAGVSFERADQLLALSLTASRRVFQKKQEFVFRPFGKESRNTNCFPVKAITRWMSLNQFSEILLLKCRLMTVSI
jgi:hypothetical protein